MECARAIGGDVGAGILTVLVRLTVGLVAMYPLLDSRADVLLLNCGTSTLRTDADPEPESGVYAVLLEEPPSSLLLRADERLPLTSSTTPLDFGRP